MFSSEILASRTSLPPFLPTLGTRCPAYCTVELRDAADMAAIFTVCLCTANSGRGATPLLIASRGPERAAIIIDEGDPAFERIVEYLG